MPIYIDQMQREIALSAIPKRIISLVPSQSELLYDLGLEQEIVGITKFCIHPDHLFRSKKRIGGTKQINLERIDALQPDLIIGNKEENDQIQIETLSKKYPVWMSDIKKLEDAYEMIDLIGVLTNKQSKASTLIQEIKARFQNITIKKRKKAAYLIWKDPYMVAGKNTFIDEMMQKAGLDNIVAINRYPILTMEEFISLSPEVILLSSEPFPFKEKHIVEFKAQLPTAQVKIVDGMLFSWYGSKLLLSPQYFNELQDGF